MVHGEQVLEHFVSVGRADGVVDAVVLGKSLNLVTRRRARSPAACTPA